MIGRVLMSFAGALTLTVAFLASAPLFTHAQNRAAEVTAGDERQAVVFTNPALITIADHTTASPYPSSISVSGVSGNIPATAGSVKVTLNGFSHTFPDDVGVVLVGPTGAALLLQDGAGDVNSIMTNVTYTFSDAAVNQLPNLTAWTAGTYKPTAYFAGDTFPAPGPGTTYGNPGPAGGGAATFASVFAGTSPNGTWNLYVVDFTSGDSGQIAGGWTLEILGGGMTPVQHVVDFDGDGKTDPVVIRNTGGGTSGQMTWYVHKSTGGDYAQPWGLASDRFVAGDFDGDHKSDITVWRPGTQAYFYIFQSLTSTVRAVPFGQTNDDPTVIGDYTGDGKFDPAVYRAGATAGAQSFWYYLASSGPLSGQIVGTQWGQNGDFPAPGDYNGDGKGDFCVQRNAGGGSAAFYEHNGTGGGDVAGPTTVTFFGTPTDVVVPGDYDADGKTDIATLRGVGGQIAWYYDPSSIPGVQAVTTLWGASATDFPTQGDYDGDGKTDVAVWRPSTTAGQTSFYYLGSTSGAHAFQYGQNGDYPVATFNGH